MKDTRFVALDVHKDRVAAAMARLDGEDARDLGIVPYEPDAVARLLRRLGPPESLLVAYEAGPCGYGLYRKLEAMGIRCVVVAASLVPRRSGEDRPAGRAAVGAGYGAGT